MNSDRGYWERHASNYDASLGPLGRPLPRMLQLVAGAARGARNVLEVAAGTGLVTTCLAEQAERVVATDYAESMVRALSDRVRQGGLKNVSCEQADLYDLRFDAGTFDVVVAANVLHLVPDLPGALVALRRVLAPGGRLIVPTFCHDETRLSWVVSRVLALTGFPGHRRFEMASLVAAVERSGLVIEMRETLPGLIPVGHVHGKFLWSWFRSIVDDCFGARSPQPSLWPPR